MWVQLNVVFMLIAELGKMLFIKVPIARFLVPSLDHCEDTTQSACSSDHVEGRGVWWGGVGWGCWSCEAVGIAVVYRI